MIELVKSSVVFSEENHTYFLGEKQLKGITGMISRQLFPNKYRDIPEYILKKAAEKAVVFMDNASLLMLQDYHPRVLKLLIISGKE